MKLKRRILLTMSLALLAVCLAGCGDSPGEEVREVPEELAGNLAGVGFPAEFIEELVPEQAQACMTQLRIPEPDL